MNKSIYLILFLFFLPLSVGCNRDHHQSQQTNLQSNVIVMLGDSITARGEWETYYPDWIFLVI